MSSRPTWAKLERPYFKNKIKTIQKGLGDISSGRALAKAKAKSWIQSPVLQKGKGGKGGREEKGRG
jgi:hypothetical protein